MNGTIWTPPQPYIQIISDKSVVFCTIFSTKPYDFVGFRYAIGINKLAKVVFDEYLTGSLPVPVR